LWYWIKDNKKLFSPSVQDAVYRFIPGMISQNLWLVLTAECWYCWHLLVLNCEDVDLRYGM
jgi:hypothetical protein